MLATVSFPINFLTGKLLSGQPGQKTSWRGWTAIMILSLIWTSMSVVRLPDLQYATYAFFLFYRLLIFVNLYHFVGEYFPDPKKFGYLAYGSISLAGALTYTAPLINKLAVNVFHSDFTVVNMCLGGVEVICCLVMIRFTWPGHAYARLSNAESDTAE